MSTECGCDITESLIEKSLKSWVKRSILLAVSCSSVLQVLLFVFETYNYGFFLN